MKTTSISQLITLTLLAFLLSTEAQTTGRNDQQQSNRGCRIRAANPLMHDIIRNKLAEEMLNLIEYKLAFRNYSYNPMTTNVTRYHKADTWSRVSTYQGQILLSLAFNYRILSLMTLTVGTNSTEVELEDIPSGCIGELPEEQKVELVRQLLMRDFKEDGNVSIVGEERVCNTQITNQSGYAKFAEYCCSVDTHTKDCRLNDGNQWLRVMWIMLTVVRYGVLLFGPLLFLSTIAKMVNRKIPYVVTLGVPLQKKIMVSRLEPDTKRFDVKRRVNLQGHKQNEFPMLIESLCRRQLSIGSNCEMIDEKPFRSFIYEYRIGVNYTRLLMEDEVPVGFWKLILKSVFFCELRDVGPFVDCCKQRICNICPDPGFLWIKFWKIVGLCLFILLLPMPYYLRLVIFYFFEQEEIMWRTEAVTRTGLKLSFENSIVHYILPTHPLFLTIYAMYFTFALAFAFASKMKVNPFQKIIVGSFEDLNKLSWFDVLHMMVSNVIWPFEQFGIYGIFIIFIYWPIVLPITCLVSVSYCIPTIYLTIRMFFHQIISIMDRIFKPDLLKNMLEAKILWKLFYVSDQNGNNARKSYDPENNQCPRNTLKSIFVADYEVDMLKNDSPKITDQSPSSTTAPMITTAPNSSGNILVQMLTAMFCVAAMYSILIILSECIGCFVDIVIFTMMGIIVNAGALLKYVSLAVLLLVYAFDSFNNVEKMYLQLNQALFNIVKERVKKLDEVTSQTSDQQENIGFKSQKLRKKGKHGQPDDIAKDMSRYWFINDLILFVDYEDVPRIPKKLFDEVCHIKASGVPGPVYLGLLSALQSFAKIAIFVTFVFLVILSFGGAYGLSSTTQTIAALAVGLGPRLMDTLVQPPKTEIDSKSVSFSNKLDEVVMNFYQFWPIKDLCFTMQKKQEKEGSECGDAPNVSTNPVVDSREDFNEVKTVSSTDEDFLMLSKCDRIKTEQNDTDDRPEIEKMLRRDLKREEVDIVIILPKDFDEHWNDEWTKFITKDNSRKNKTTVHTNEYDSRETQLKASTAPRSRKTAKFTDDAIDTETDGSGLFIEVAEASVQA